jgi:hypothetical protein
MSNYFDNSEAIDAWLQKRRSRFTSSENYKLLGVPKESKFFWSTAANTYIESKVIELTTKMYERPQIEEVEALRHGKANEFPSYERYIKETKNYSMTYMGDENPMFIPCKKLIDESGGTPDVGNLVQDETCEVKIDYGCELKNPVNPAYHFRRLAWRSMWDVKEGYPSCYAQIQDLIRLTGAFGWDFVSHDERQLARSKQIVIIEIKPDRKFIDNLELRIELAVKEKYKQLSKHMGAEIKNRTEFINFVNQ